jgi:ParB family transcriptional regulator, chromosome partitioning protein
MTEVCCFHSPFHLILPVKIELSFVGELIVILSSIRKNIKYWRIIGYLLQRGISTSSLLIGIIEEIDIHRIKLPELTLYGADRNETPELVDSIRQNGLLHPIIVRTRRSSFEIIAGCRRYNACRKLGLRRIICHIVELDDKSAFEISLIENIQRRSLDPIEEARAFRCYVDDRGWGGLTELASKISKSTAYICKRLSLLELPEELLKQISSCRMCPSTAEELIPLKDSNERHRIAGLVIKNAYSSRQTRKLVRTSQEGPNSDDDLMAYQDKIVDLELKATRSFDKSITALKIAMGKISSIAEAVEDNWIIYEILLQHKNMLNAQIDVLIREKKKLR